MLARELGSRSAEQALGPERHIQNCNKAPVCIWQAIKANKEKEEAEAAEAARLAEEAAQKGKTGKKGAKGKEASSSSSKASTARKSKSPGPSRPISADKAAAKPSSTGVFKSKPVRLQISGLLLTNSSVVLPGPESSWDAQGPLGLHLSHTLYVMLDCRPVMRARPTLEGVGVSEPRGKYSSTVQPMGAVYCVAGHHWI